MQTIEQSEAGQRSFELQDCAKHMHSKLNQLAQCHNLLDWPSFWTCCAARQSRVQKQ